MASRYVESLSVVLPAYNEEEVISETVSRVSNYLRRNFDDFEILVVNDGSTDGTSRIVRELREANDHLRLVEHDKNLGYGGALRTGFGEAQKEWILLMDSDGQFEVGSLGELLPYCRNSDLVIGRRRKRQDPWMRKVYTWGYNLLVGIMFGMNYDYGCAFKLFKREAWLKVQPIVAKDHKIFSVEWLLKSRRLGLRIAEVPVSHWPRKTGKSTGARPDVIVAMVVDLVRLWCRDRFCKS